MLRPTAGPHAHPGSLPAQFRKSPVRTESVQQGKRPHGHQGAAGEQEQHRGTAGGHRQLR